MLYLQWAVIAISTLFPIAFVIAPKGAGASFYLLLLTSLLCIACRFRPAGKSFLQLLREYWPVNLAMAGLALAVLANQAFSGSFSSRAYELPLQLACFPLLFWVLLLGSDKNLRLIQWGFVAGSLVCAGALYAEVATGVLRPDFVLGIPLVPFTNLAILLGALSLLSLGWNDRTDILANLLKIMAGVAALYGSYLSLTRSGWMALPLFVLIALAVFRNMRFYSKLALLVFVAAMFAGSYMFSDAVRGRFDIARSDIQQYVDGTNKNTSLGQRLQLWQGAWLLFKEYPLFGTGRERYRESAQQLAARQVITPFAATQPHSHNDLLFHLATLGLFGLIGILPLYFVPAYYFFRDIRHQDRETRTIAGMGLALTLGFFVFGLTDAMFYWRVSYIFYVILLAVLFACMVRRKALLMGQDRQPSFEDNPVAYKAESGGVRSALKENGHQMGVDSIDAAT